MELRHLPESLVVVGGNYIGLELGQVFANLGSKVTIVEALERIAPLEEPEISETLTGILSDDGIRVVTSAEVTRVEGGPLKKIFARTLGGEVELEATEVLVATGRRPVLGGLGLDAAGVELDERGGLAMDGSLRTTNVNVFAAGDVTGAPPFVYVAAAQGPLAAQNALTGGNDTLDYAALPRVTFTTPNIAAVGLTDAQAQAARHECECRVVELRHVPRARVNLDTRGPVQDRGRSVDRERWSACTPSPTSREMRSLQVCTRSDSASPSPISRTPGRRISRCPRGSSSRPRASRPTSRCFRAAPRKRREELLS
jgi:mercuric reductase